MLNLKQNKGITLVALTVMIIVISILAGISITQGTGLIEKTKLENYKTNMITIKAKSKVYAEEISAEIWDVSDKESKRAELYLEKYKMEKMSDDADIVSKVNENINSGNGCECYKMTKEALKQMGLEDISNDANDGDYVVIYNKDSYKNIEVMYVLGIRYKGSIYYTLSSLQELEQE